MPSKRYKTEEVIHKLREADVLLTQGSAVPEVCKQPGVFGQTHHRWRKLHGGMQVDHAKRSNALKAEKARLRRVVADLAPGGVEGVREATEMWTPVVERSLLHSPITDLPLPRLLLGLRVHSHLRWPGGEAGGGSG